MDRLIRFNAALVKILESISLCVHYCVQNIAIYANILDQALHGTILTNIFVHKQINERQKMIRK